MKATAMKNKSIAIKKQEKKALFESVKECTIRADKHLNSFTCKINTIKEDIFLTSRISDCAKELERLYSKIGYEYKALFCQKKNTILLKKDGKSKDFKDVFNAVFADCLEVSFGKINNERLLLVLKSLKSKLSVNGSYFRLIVDKFSASLYSGNNGITKNIPVVSDIEKKMLVSIIKEYIMIDDCIRVEFFFSINVMEMKCYSIDRKTIFTKNTLQCIDLFKRIPA